MVLGLKNQREEFAEFNCDSFHLDYHSSLHAWHKSKSQYSLENFIASGNIYEALTNNNIYAVIFTTDSEQFKYYSVSNYTRFDVGLQNSVYRWNNISGV